MWSSGVSELKACAAAASKDCGCGVVRLRGGGAPRALDGRRLRNRQQQQQVIKGSQIKGRLARVTGPVEHVLLQAHAARWGELHSASISSQRVQVLVQRSLPGVSNARTPAHGALKWRMNCWRRALKCAARLKVRYRRSKSRYAHQRGFLMLGNMRGATPPRPGSVFAHGHEKLCLLLNIEQLLWIDDVVQWCLRCWCSPWGAGPKPASSSETSPGSAAFSAATACTTGMGAATRRGRSRGQGTTPAVCRRCNHPLPQFPDRPHLARQRFDC